MAGIKGGFLGFLGHPRASAPDSDVARRTKWLLGAMVIGSAAGLLATSDNQTFVRFATTIQAPPATLTAAQPTAKFLVITRVSALGPANADSTEGATAEVLGTITGSNTGPRPFVSVRMDPSARNTPDAGLEVLTSFQMSRLLSFTGACQKLDLASPCQAQWLIEFARDDAGAAGGTITVDWKVEFSSQAPRSSGPDEGPITPPWDVQVVQQ